MGLGSVVSSLVGGKGAKKARNAANAAQKKAMQEYANAYSSIDEAYNRYLPQAQQGYDNYANTLRGDMRAFDASPYGKFYDEYNMNNTINRLQGTAAARGNLLSGNALKELQTNIQSILSSDYLNRLGQYLGYNQNLGNVALGITDSLNNYRWQQAQANAGAQTQIGNNNAAYQLSKYNNLGNLYGGLVDWGMNALTPFGSSGTGSDSGLTTAINTFSNLVGSVRGGGGAGVTNTTTGYNPGYYSINGNNYVAWSK